MSGLSVAESYDQRMRAVQGSNLRTGVAFNLHGAYSAHYVLNEGPDPLRSCPERITILSELSGVLLNGNFVGMGGGRRGERRVGQEIEQGGRCFDLKR